MHCPREHCVTQYAAFFDTLQTIALKENRRDKGQEAQNISEIPNKQTLLSKHPGIVICFVTRKGKGKSIEVCKRDKYHAEHKNM